MKQHKWHKEIKAWADGAEMQIKHIELPYWTDINNPDWNDEVFEYRIKPQPKESRIIREMKEAMEDLQKSLGKESKPKEPQYLYVYLAKDNSVAFKPRASLEVMNEDYMGKVKYKDFMESLRRILLND